MEKQAAGDPSGVTELWEEWYESHRNCPQDRRPGPGGHPQGDPPHPEDPGGRPVTDNIGTVGTILLRHERFSQTAGMGVVHSDEMVGLSRGNTEEGETEGKRRTVVDAGIVRHFTMTLKEVFC